MSDPLRWPTATAETGEGDGGRFAGALDRDPESSPMHSHLYRPFPLVGLTLLALACGGKPAPLPAQEPAAAKPAPSPEPPRFIRLVEDGKGGGSFQTAVTSYRDDAGHQVDLVAAVHIADPAHYQEIQQELDRHDRVLYELVASPDVRPRPGLKRESGNPISFVQRAMTRGLQLAFQLDSIDYRGDRFVHADLTPAGFEEEMKKRGQSVWDQVFALMGRDMKRMREEAGGAGDADEEGEAEEADRDEESTDEGDDFDLVSAFQRGEGRHMLRMLFAKELAGVLGAGAPPPDDGGGTVLLEGRNERAVEVLREQLDDGQDDIAIYYGAAHMPGIERALTEELGFHRVGQRWLVAWDLTPRPDSVGPLDDGDAPAAEEGKATGAEASAGDRSK